MMWGLLAIIVVVNLALLLTWKRHRRRNHVERISRLRDQIAVERAEEISREASRKVCRTGR